MKVPFYKSRLLSDYSLIEKLEKKFSEYTGFKYGIAVDSCTSAIKLCLEYEKPKVVTIPDITYVSVAHEIIHCGAKLKLEDTHSVGHAYPLKGTNIWDSAHEVQKDIGKHLKDANFCYSFYPTKLVPSYQGGMICTNDLKLATWAKVARLMGRTGYGSGYDVPVIGWKCNMTPIQAKEALKSLKLLPKIEEEQFSQALNYVDMLNYNHVEIGVGSSSHLFSCYVHNRDAFMEHMQKKGVGCSIHFKPIHTFTAFKRQFKCQKFTYCDEVYSKTVSLPIYPGLKRRDQVKICKEIVKWEGKRWES